jgi:hypothetical protein
MNETALTAAMDLIEKRVTKIADTNRHKTMRSVEQVIQRNLIPAMHRVSLWNILATGAVAIGAFALASYTARSNSDEYINEDEEY